MLKRKKPTFLRIGYTQYSKLGLRRKNKQVYRKGKGGENKMRLKMKGHLRNVNIGFRTEKKTRNLVSGLKPVMIFNISDLKNLKKDEIGIVAKVGAKRRLELADYAFKNTIKLQNLNSSKFIEKMNAKKKLKDEMRSEKEKKKAEKEKAAAEKEKTTKKDKAGSASKETEEPKKTETKIEEPVKVEEKK